MSLDVLICDEIGQLEADFIAVIDIILRGMYVPWQIICTSSPRRTSSSVSSGCKQKENRSIWGSIRPRYWLFFGNIFQFSRPKVKLNLDQ